MASPGGVEVHEPAHDKYPEVLSDEALGLVAARLVDLAHRAVFSWLT